MTQRSKRRPHCYASLFQPTSEVSQRWGGRAVRESCSTTAGHPNLDTFDVDPGDLGEARRDRVGQELHLCCPSGFVGLDRQHSVVESDRPDVGRNRLTDGVIPPAEDSTDLDSIGATQRLHDPIERFRDRHRLGHDRQPTARSASPAER